MSSKQLHYPNRTICVLIVHMLNFFCSTLPAKPSQSIINYLKALTDKPNTYVYILSGRGRQHLDTWFGSVGVGLSAEHGCFYKHPASIRDQIDPTEKNATEGKVVREEDANWYRLVEQVDPTWKETIRPLFQHYTERTPGSFIEEKEVGFTIFSTFVAVALAEMKCSD